MMKIVPRKGSGGGGGSPQGPLNQELQGPVWCGWGSGGHRAAGLPCTSAAPGPEPLLPRPPAAPRSSLFTAPPSPDGGQLSPQESLCWRAPPLRPTPGPLPPAGMCVSHPKCRVLEGQQPPRTTEAPSQGSLQCLLHHTDCPVSTTQAHELPGRPGLQEDCRL